MQISQEVLRCYYCERFYYDMHPEWIDHIIKKAKIYESSKKKSRSTKVSKKNSNRTNKN